MKKSDDQLIWEAHAGHPKFNIKPVSKSLSDEKIWQDLKDDILQSKGEKDDVYEVDLPKEDWPKEVEDSSLDTASFGVSRLVNDYTFDELLNWFESDLNRLFSAQSKNNDARLNFLRRRIKILRDALKQKAELNI